MSSTRSSRTAFSTYDERPTLLRGPSVDQRGSHKIGDMIKPVSTIEDFNDDACTEQYVNGEWKKVPARRGDDAPRRLGSQSPNSRRGSAFGNAPSQAPSSRRGTSFRAGPPSQRSNSQRGSEVSRVTDGDTEMLVGDKWVPARMQTSQSPESDLDCGTEMLVGGKWVPARPAARAADSDEECRRPSHVSDRSGSQLNGSRRGSEFDREAAALEESPSRYSRQSASQRSGKSPSLRGSHFSERKELNSSRHGSQSAVEERPSLHASHVSDQSSSDFNSGSEFHSMSNSKLESRLSRGPRVEDHAFDESPSRHGSHFRNQSGSRHGGSQHNSQLSHHSSTRSVDHLGCASDNQPQVHSESETEVLLNDTWQKMSVLNKMRNGPQSPSGLSEVDSEAEPPSRHDSHFSKHSEPHHSRHGSRLSRGSAKADSEEAAQSLHESRFSKRSERSPLNASRHGVSQFSRGAETHEDSPSHYSRHTSSQRGKSLTLQNSRFSERSEGQLNASRYGGSQFAEEASPSLHEPRFSKRSESHLDDSMHSSRFSQGVEARQDSPSHYSRHSVSQRNKSPSLQNSRFSERSEAQPNVSINYSQVAEQAPPSLHGLHSSKGSERRVNDSMYGSQVSRGAESIEVPSPSRYSRQSASTSQHTLQPCDGESEVVEVFEDGKWHPVNGSALDKQSRLSRGSRSSQQSTHEDRQSTYGAAESPRGTEMLVNGEWVPARSRQEKSDPHDLSFSAKQRKFGGADESGRGPTSVEAPSQRGQVGMKTPAGSKTMVIPVGKQWFVLKEYPDRTPRICIKKFTRSCPEGHCGLAVGDCLLSVNGLDVKNASEKMVEKIWIDASNDGPSLELVFSGLCQSLA